MPTRGSIGQFPVRRCYAPARMLRVSPIVALVACAACAPSNGRERASSTPPPAAPADASLAEAEALEPAEAGPAKAGMTEARPVEVRAEDPHFTAGAKLGGRAHAITVFKKLWTDHLAAHIDGKQPKVGSDWSSVLARKGQPIDATREDCGALRERIRSTFAPGEAPSVLFGELTRLRDGQSCWAVAAPAGFHTLLTYLSEANGEVLLVWVPPEG